MRLPGRLLKPAWTTAELRPLVPAATSHSFSSTMTEGVYRVSARATAHPTAPAPMMRTSQLVGMVVTTSFR